MESTDKKRIWKKGPPPHVGWWNATNAVGGGREFFNFWRWWNGEQWSVAFTAECPDHDFNRTKQHDPSSGVWWTDYWPEDARVPRIDPAGPSVLWGGARWYLLDGVPTKSTPPQPPFNDKAGWLRWAEQRNKMTGPLGLTPRAEQRSGAMGALYGSNVVNGTNPPLGAEKWPQVHPNQLPNAHILGRTRMVDGCELEQLALDAMALAKRLRALSNGAS